MVRFLFLSKLRHDCLQVGVVLDGDPVLQVLLLLVYGILGESEERESFSADNIIVDWECLGAEQIRQVGLSLASEFELVIAHTVDPAVELIGECVTCSTYDQVPVARLMAQRHRSVVEMDIFPVVVGLAYLVGLVVDCEGHAISFLFLDDHLDELHVVPEANLGAVPVAGPELLVESVIVTWNGLHIGLITLLLLDGRPWRN